MATIKREKLGKRGFDTLHREQQYEGWEGIDGCGYGSGDNVDLAAMEADWQSYQSDLMHEWGSAWADRLLGVKRYGFGEPSCRSLRPWAFWRFVVKVEPPDLAEELEVLTEHGLARPGDADRHAFLLAERAEQERYHEEFERHRLGRP